MEQDIEIRTITQTAASHIPTICKAYRHLGITCDPTPSRHEPAAE